MRPTYENEIRQTIVSFQPKKSCGYDALSLLVMTRPVAAFTKFGCVLLLISQHQCSDDYAELWSLQYI